MCGRLLGFILLICLPGVLQAQDPEPACDSPQLKGGYSVIAEDADSHEPTLFYACDDGLKPAVEGWWGTATCQDRKWVPKPQCIDKKACILPEIPNAKYTKSPNGWYEEGHKIRVRCFDGYEDKNQHATAQCMNGNWTSMPICERDVNACELPRKIRNAVVIKQVYQEVFLENSQVEYVCEEGYTTNRGAIQTSLCSMGNWTEVSECTIKTEPIPGDDGSEAGATETSSGHRVTTGRGAQPTDGRSTSGTDRDTSDRTSTTVKCGTAPTIHNGDIVEENLQYLKYQCSAFYSLQGSDTVKCNSNGSWSEPPTCLDNFCVVDTAAQRHLVDVGSHFIKSGRYLEFQCAYSSDTSYVHCDNRRVTFGRCCNSHDRYWGYCQ